MTLNLLNEIEGATDFPGVANAVHWQTMGGRFDFVAAVLSDDQRVIQINVRDPFDEDLCRQTLLFALEHESKVLECESVVVLDGFRAANYDFETVVALAPKLHNVHKADRPELHKLTFAIFPAFRCEFNGDEDDDDLKYLSQKVKRADLRRDRKPIVRMRFYNQRMGIWSTASGRGLNSKERLTSAIGQLEHSPNSYVEFENFRHQVAAVTWEEGFVLRWGSHAQPINKEELTWIDEFLVEGVSHDDCQTLMRLELENRTVIYSPNDDDVRQAVGSLTPVGNSFLILADSQLTYFQTAKREDGSIIVEYQTGTLDQHFVGDEFVDESMLVKMLLSYLHDSDDWYHLVKWNQVSYE